jgi:nitrous oxide reductase accessory protein NosL
MRASWTRVRSRAGIVPALVLAVLLGWASLSRGEHGEAQRPAPVKPKDRCPVCGMFVAKYPDFAAQLRFRDGSYFAFDGVKDLMKFYLDMPRYAPGRKPADVTAVFVTDYYGMAPVDGRKAWYVDGSDVHGPMGKELVPFEKEKDAREFLKDHKGRAILRFDRITPSVLATLE